MRAEHHLGIYFYDDQGRQSAYFAPACEAWDRKEMVQINHLLAQRDEGDYPPVFAPG